MTRAVWLGEPEITAGDHELRIEQDCRVGAFKPFTCVIEVTRYSDGDTRFQVGWRDGPVEFPAHWMPYLLAFLTRLEVAA